jgi:hypothetical protein
MDSIQTLVKKRKNKKNKKNGLEIKTYKSAENNAENRKKLKYDEMYQNVQGMSIFLLFTL